MLPGRKQATPGCQGLWMPLLSHTQRLSNDSTTTCGGTPLRLCWWPIWAQLLLMFQPLTVLGWNFLYMVFGFPFVALACQRFIVYHLIHNFLPTHMPSPTSILNILDSLSLLGSSQPFFLFPQLQQWLPVSLSSHFPMPSSGLTCGQNCQPEMLPPHLTTSSFSALTSQRVGPPRWILILHMTAASHHRAGILPCTSWYFSSQMPQRHTWHIICAQQMLTERI
jgi:hypothetical protein